MMRREVEFDTLIDWAADNAAQRDRTIYVAHDGDSIRVTFDEPETGDYWAVHADGRRSSHSIIGY